ncbi:heavy metal translocating P-type ATPase [Polynucleobacter sp. MG-6-Vaara-E2]|uniref:heavy metal translocating P-type ATPase n=1 Tax=Polynucleobacter sp. MG-6-Vaara-E2 TaxID=2576932 RepID=UPI001BFE6968|nr:heavy metal translocating P-type ATPase [Polynucleobacter sp. MG-6-Vaara-E2]QWD96153.1 heavy metal translocating P-type ATPase [Polynucleobacter sp. MG-6-Vaara-E2]
MNETSRIKPICYHCSSSILPSDVIEAELGGVQRQFCCPGCMAIAQTIHGEGLEVFYARRARTSDKPPAYLASNEIPEKLKPYDDPSLRNRFTRPRGDKDCLETTLRLEKIRCAACVWLCEQHLRRQVGVIDVQINYVTQKVMVHFDSEKTSLARLLFEIERIGYEAWPFEPSIALDKAKKEKRQLLTRLGVAMLGMMQVMMYAWPTYVGADITPEFEVLLGWTSWALTVPVMVYSAGPIFQAAWRSIQSVKKTHMLGMDVPIALALALAFIAGTINLVRGSGQSYFDSITMFVAFILAARYVELLARQDAQGGAEALAKQLPATCDRLINYPDSLEVQIVPVVNCNPGDVLRVSPGEVVPADSILIDNASTLDESLLTGESKPVEKKMGDRVYAGTHNILNPLIMRIDAVGQSTRIAGIASLLDRALLAKPVMVSLAEKWAAYFVAFLLLSAFVSSAIWLYFDPSQAWTVLVSVLVASCPCALSLAVPTAMAAAQGAVTKLGLLIVRGHVLEGLVKATDLVLDKTGTLTMGQPELQEIVNLRADFSREDALALALALEAGQRHPLALSLLRAAELEKISPAVLNDSVINELGKGLSAGPYRLGSALWIGIGQNAQQGQYGQVHLADEKGLIASFVFLDTPRVGLRNLLQAAKSRNIAVHLVSGDDPATVAWWAKHVGIESYQGACTPEEKYEYIERLQNQKRFVWAIGDGVNDAPLLARADISIAVGAGAPLAAAGADAILTASSLEPLAKTLALADKTQTIIKENLWWALIYNLLAIPAAMLGLVNPWIAGIGMSLSSLAVTLNAWRLRKA